MPSPMRSRLLVWTLPLLTIKLVRSRSQSLRRERLRVDSPVGADRSRGCFSRPTDGFTFAQRAAAFGETPKRANHNLRRSRERTELSAGQAQLPASAWVLVCRLKKMIATQTMIPRKIHMARPPEYLEPHVASLLQRGNYGAMNDSALRSNIGSRPAQIGIGETKKTAQRRSLTSRLPCAGVRVLRVSDQRA
jgi:hypothetical protein